jgi:hypothetical protein
LWPFRRVGIWPVPEHSLNVAYLRLCHARGQVVEPVVGLAGDEARDGGGEAAGSQVIGDNTHPGGV